MFAEELKGNASKKRQEEARERRRKLKQKQQQEKILENSVQNDKEPSFAGDVEGRSMARASVGSSTATVTAQLLSNKAVLLSAVSSQNNPSSAVAIALEQRQLRQETYLRQRSATTIQSMFRANKSNRSLMQTERKVLKQRLADLSTLRTLLKKSGKSSSYVPPPATATSMTRQLLFLTRITPYNRREELEEVVVQSREEIDFVHQVITYVIAPGLKSKDENLDPILPWFSSPEGRIRFLRLLRLCLIAGTTRSVTAETLLSVNTFLRDIIGIVSPNGGTVTRDAIVRIARAMLLPKIAPSLIAPPVSIFSTNKAVKPYQHSVQGPSLDLLRVLRRHLLFNTGTGPIPSTAERIRESCISAKERDHADSLFQLAVDAVLSVPFGPEARRLQSRFVAEILTVPLLLWKTSAASISKLLTSSPPHWSSRTSILSRNPELIITFVSAFVEEHAATLSAGKVASVLQNLDASLIVCPAPPEQCLLANLIQIGRICSSINGSEVNTMDYQAGAFYFDFVATLIDAVPIGTFSSRESAVEWICVGASHTPIVLSPVIIGQCKLLLVDSYIRDLFTCAINKTALDTSCILQAKNAKDMKHETDLTEAGASATTLAAKEARVNRTKGFWQSSKWARKLSSSMSQLISGEGSGGDRPITQKKKGKEMLLNTSLISKKLAQGKSSDGVNVRKAVIASKRESSKAKKTNAESVPPTEYSSLLLFSLCRVYGTILARWGGTGKDDIINRAVNPPRMSAIEGMKDKATSAADPCTLSLLNVLCFSTDIIEAVWSLIQSHKAVVSDIYSIIDASESKIPIRSITIRPTYHQSEVYSQTGGNIGSILLYVFVCSLSHVLIVTDDCEIHDMDKPLPIHQLRRCIQVLKQLLYRACCLDDIAYGQDVTVSNYFGLSLISSASRTMRDLYDRSSRKPLAIPKLYVVDDLLEKDLRRCKRHEDYIALLSCPVLRVCPFLVSFKRRLKLFERIVTTSRIEIQGNNDNYTLKPGIPVRITRGRVLEDGLLTLNKLGRDLKKRISVQYVNEGGAQESGVDVGGLFKEFWTDLSGIAFNPNYALFKVTEGAGNCLYPSPSSGAAHGSDHIILFEFLGRILGKALYEGITIHPQFAHFFLSFLRGDYNFLHMLPDLSTIDPTLYNNLMFLKTYDGDAEELCLTFSVANADFGSNKEVPLIPNGADIIVTNLNKQRYIGLVAKHHVCDRLKEQSEAFTRGLWDVIDRSWLRLFNEPELQVLISGSADGKIDIADMRSNTQYLGGYSRLDRHINRFWSAVSSLSSKQQADLLRFVTSCERPPPLGFACMHPPFSIQRVQILRDGGRLPTASTCFNILKLPTYSSEKVLKQRLIYAIESGTGFELS